MKEIKLFDFDNRFTKDYLRWCTDHPEANDPDKLELMIPHMHKQWMNTPKKWLDGLSPVDYFKNIDDIQHYLTLFIEYIKNGISVPEPLLDCIIERKEDAYPTFLNILYSKCPDDMDQETFTDHLAAVVSLINEMDLKHPLTLYVQKLSEAGEFNDFNDEIFETLENNISVPGLKDSILNAYSICTEDYGKKCLLELLSHYSEDDDKIKGLIRDLFSSAEKDDIPFYGSLMIKANDDKALEYLERSIKRKDIDYYTYRTLADLIESLTGEEYYDDRDFTGDEYYEMLISDDEQ